MTDANARNAKVLTAAALLELEYVSDPVLSPGGDRAAAVVTRTVADDPPRYVSRVALYDVASAQEVASTQGLHQDTFPRFSPDGSRLAFLSDREGRAQVYVLGLGGGEAHKLTSFGAGVTEFAWHPDGTRLALVSRGDAPPEDRGLGRKITRTYYKQDGAGFRPEGAAQLYLLDIRTRAVKGVAQPETNPGDLAFGPDGPLYFTAAHTVEDEGYYYRNVWRLDLETGDLTALIEQPNPLIASSPSVSPDGTTVAYLAPCLPERMGSPTGLWIVPNSGGQPTLLTGELECAPLVGGDARYGRLANVPVWADAHTLLVNGNVRGSSAVTRVGIATLEQTPLQAPGRAVTAFAAAGGTLVFTAETPDRPGELFMLRNGQETQLSRVNRDFCERYTLSAISPEVALRTADGEAEIAYWTLAPAEARADRALVLQVHGGPRTNYGYGFSFEFQLLAAHGYGVVFGNPRGGSSYGYGFSNSISGRLGTVDADDVMQMARHARAQHTDPDAPVHLTGGSYGGFMTNWLVTQTDLFTSAVTQRSISNWLSFFGTSDIGFSWIHIEVGGNPWRDTQKLWDQSPLKHVANVTTPLLIVHSDEDHRCPVEQAEQFYTALRVLGQEVALLRFPDEGHDLSRSGRPDRRVQRLAAIVGWFEGHPRRTEAAR